MSQQSAAEYPHRSRGVTFLAIVNALALVITVLFWGAVLVRLPFPGGLPSLVERANAAVTYGFMIGDVLYSAPLLLLAWLGLWRLRVWGWLAAQMANALWVYSMTVILFRDAYTTLSPGGMLFLPFAAVAVWAVPYLWMHRDEFGITHEQCSITVPMFTKKKGIGDPKYICYTSSVPDVNDFWRLFNTTGWNDEYNLSRDALISAATKSWRVVSAYDGDLLVGFGRVVSDGILHAMIYDLIVDPGYQSRGIGAEILARLVQDCLAARIRDIQLFCARGKRKFYETRGFRSRSEDAPGMDYVGVIPPDAIVR